MAPQTLAMARAAFSSAALLATFACVAATRCTALLMLPRGMWQFQQLLQTWSPLQEHARTMLRQPRFESERCLLYVAYAASRPAPCLLRTKAKHTLPPLRARFHMAAENFISSLRVLHTRTSHKYDRMWLVGLHVLP